MNLHSLLRFFNPNKNGVDPTEDKGTVFSRQDGQRNSSSDKKKKKQKASFKFPRSGFLESFSSRLSSRERSAKDDLVGGLRRQISELKSENEFYRMREKPRQCRPDDNLKQNSVFVVNSLRRENADLRKELSAAEKTVSILQAQNDDLRAAVEGLNIRNKTHEEQENVFKRAVQELVTKNAEIERASLAVQHQRHQTEMEARQMQENLEFFAQQLLARERELGRVKAEEEDQVEEMEIEERPMAEEARTRDDEVFASTEIGCDDSSSMRGRSTCPEVGPPEGGWPIITDVSSPEGGRLGNSDSSSPEGGRLENSDSSFPEGGGLAIKEERGRTRNRRVSFSGRGRTTDPDVSSPERGRTTNSPEGGRLKNTDVRSPARRRTRNPDASFPVRGRKTPSGNRTKSNGAYEILVQEGFRGMIVGRGGRTIRHLRKKHRVKFELPPRNSQSDVVRLIGASSDVMRVIGELERMGIVFQEA